MPKLIKLTIDCVNKVKMEKLENFQESIFRDVYMSAHMQVGRIMEMTRAQDMDDDAEKFCNGNEMSNVISFVGERGMGKSSAMLSFAYFLKQYPNALRGETDNAFKFKGKECKFYVLPKIDAAILTNESLFDVVLAKMWTDFSDITAGVSEDNFGFSHTKESFNSIKDAYTLYYKDEKQNKNLTSVRQLQELSRSLALREQFARLVESFLEYIIVDSQINEKNRYLVIPIDDLDLANDMSLAILEHIRIFLSVPQVIILATVDIEKLTLCGNKKFSDELICENNMDQYEKDLVRQYSDRYIAKVLPRNSRIYMPRYGGIEARNYVLDYEKYVAFLKEGGLQNSADKDYISYINMIAAKYHNLIMRYKDTLSFSAESLRNIVNKLNELWSICKYYGDNSQNAVVEWLEKEIIISNRLLSSQSNIDFMRKLRLLTEEDYNKLIIDDFKEKNLTDISKYTYGELLCTLQELENGVFENKEIAKAIIMFYSLRVVKHLNQEQYDEVENLFVRGDIFSSFLSRRLHMNFDRKMRIGNLLQLTFKYDKQEQNAGEIMRQSLPQLVDVFKAFLFCSIKSVRGSYNFEILGSDRWKEIPGIGKDSEKESGKEEKELKIGIRDAVSKISLDIFFENVIQYEELFRSYIEWIYFQLEGFLYTEDMLSWTIDETDILEPEERFEAFYNTIQNDPISGIGEISKWKEKYQIKQLYDLLPVQDVGVMLGVIERLDVSYNYQGNIYLMMEKLSEAFQQEFKEAESACEYKEWGREGYSEKLSELMKIIGLDKVPQRIKDKLIITGQLIEDTTKL